MTEIVFDLPIRIHWAVGPAASDELVKSVRRSEPLEIILHLTRSDEMEPLRLPWNGTSVTAVFHSWKSHQGPLPAGRVDRWEFPVDDIRDANRLQAERFLGIPVSRTALRWTPRRGEMGMLPEMIKSAARMGCGLALPNRTADVINTLGARAFPGPVDIDEAARTGMREAACFLEPESLRVHDYILAKVLNSGMEETGGCQAANSVAFVDRNGEVYPCESLKVALGNLGKMEMVSIWASPARIRILKEIRTLPAVCRNCPELSACRGGCRGAAFHLSGRHDQPDPMCSLCEARPRD